MPENTDNPQCCGKPMSNFSYYREDSVKPKIPHFCCSICGARIHEEKHYTADEWFFYINGITYQEYRDQITLEDGLHTHELINHSDPEK